MSAVIDNKENGFCPMRMSDLDEVMEIEQSLYDFPWSKSIFSDCIQVGYSCWTYKQSYQIQAYGVLSAAAGEAHILTLCVSKMFQGQGLGKLVLEHLIDLANDHKAEVLLLEVRPSNTRAVRLYQNYGFNEVGTRKDYYPAKDGREDALIMARDLTCERPRHDDQR